MLDRRILVLSLVFGIGVWVLDAGLDAVFFYNDPFLSLLILDIPAHELYIRILLLASFVLFGLIASRQAVRLRERDREAGLFRRLLDKSTDSILVIDPGDGSFIDVNDTACEMLGYDRSSLLEMGVPDINPRFQDTEAFRQFMQGEGPILDRYESNHIRADGTSFPVEVSASNVTVNGHRYRIAIARDITERKKREREIRESRERYESLFSSINDAIVVADTERNIIDCNPAFSDLFGYSLQEIKGQETSVLYENPEEVESMGEGLRKDVNGYTVSQTITYETKAGNPFPGMTTISSLQDATGEQMGFIGTIRDVSEQQYQRRQIKMIDTVLRHNLRNDMNVIYGYAKRIQEVTSRETADYATAIIEMGQGLVDTINKEREVTSLLADNPSPEPRDVVELITSAVEKTREGYPNADISIESVEEGNVLAVDEFRNVIDELVENAVIHSDQDVPTVKVRVECLGETVRIAVEDDGPGIPEMEQRVITEDEKITPLYHASGFGLWHVRLLVEQSGGTLSVQDRDPRGTIVSVKLPTG